VTALQPLELPRMTPPITLQSVDVLDLPVANRPWPFAVERAGWIDANWARLQAAHPKLFNGPVLMMRPAGVVTAADGRRMFRATFFETEYKAFLGHRDLGFPDVDVSNGFAMAAVRASDGGYLTGVMASHTAIAGQSQFPAGTPDPDDIRTVAQRRFVDLDASALRELREETGMPAGQVVVAPGWTIVTEGPRIAFMKRMQVALSGRALVAQVTAAIAADPQPEFSEVFVARGPDDLRGRQLSGFMRTYLAAQWAMG
jgi:8-oxo-dGTP pyrophosphatase MutT (NUDIX family)